MFKTKVGALALAAVLPLTAVAAAEAATASASTSAAATSQVTATASDPTPKSGKAFTISGKFTVNGKGVANHTVKVQSKVKGKWTMLSGAKDQTVQSGNYSIRIILNTKGERTLRVVGVGTGSQPNAAKLVNVTVH